MHTVQPKIVEGHRYIDPPKNVPVWDVDPYDIEILKNPEPYYKELLAKGPFVYIPKYAVLATGRHEVVREVFSDHTRFISSRGIGLQDFDVKKPWRPKSLLLETDPPHHAHARKIMSRELSPKVVRNFQDTYLAHARKLVTEVLARDSFDLVADLGEEFATTMIPTMIGMKERNKKNLIDYAAMVFNIVGPDNELKRTALAQEVDVVPWIMKSCQRDSLKDGGIGANIYDGVETGDLTYEEAGMLVRSLLSAGLDTTINGIAGSVCCLAQNPEAYEKLKADSSLIRPCFEEVLRLSSPVHTFYRTSNGNHEVAGISIEEGTKVMCVLGAANLDPNKWDAPEEFRIDRRPVGHLAFGAGIHGCVGQNIARAEVEAVLTAIIETVDHIELREKPYWRPNNAIHGLDKVMVTFHKKQ